MKKLLLIAFMLTASFIYSQDYQADYKKMYGEWETSSLSSVILNVNSKKTTEIQYPKGMVFMSSGIEIYESRNEVYFVPYSSIESTYGKMFPVSWKPDYFTINIRR